MLGNLDRSTQRLPKVDADPVVIAPPVARAAAELAQRYEHLYRTASGDPTCLPWHHAGVNSALVDWLNTHASCLVRPGARTVVVGCGLGDDVIELAERGYDACGFDVSPTCVEWARRRFPEHADRFFIADVLSPPTRLRARFDLVVEAFTIQSVWPDLRDHAFAGVTALAKPHATVLVMTRSREEGTSLDDCECAPYPLCASEMSRRMEGMGFAPVHEPIRCTDDHEPPGPSLVAAFRREP
jgi:SAM-dependent methyltransferase